MLRNYLKTALRSMRRHFSYSAINILGLAVGFVASFFILLWVQDELAYDTHYEGVEDVYRLMRTSDYGPDQIFTWPPITAKLDDILDEEYPEIEYAALYSWEQNMSFTRGDIAFREDGRHVGLDFFKILKHDFLVGNPLTALDTRESVVLSNNMARKYFPEFYEGDVLDVVGASRVMDQAMRLDNRLELTVTGVFVDLPAQSTIAMDYALAMEEFAVRNAWIDEWGNNGLRMLVRLVPGASHEAVTDKIRHLITENTDSDNDVLFLQQYTDVYLQSNFENGVLVGGRIDMLRIFSVVGIFILLIAAINFMNLATARSAQRALEVGIRKTFGSNRMHLAGQFLGESVLTALFALLIAGLAVFMLLPGFNELTDKEISFALIDSSVWLQFLGIAVVTGLVAGIYPAFYLSAFSVIRVLRGGHKSSGKGGNLRRGLVIVQFTLSIILIVGSVTVYNQVNYILTKDLGLDRKDVFYSRLEGPMLTQYDSYVARLESEPSIQRVSSTSTSPLSVSSSTSWGVRWDGRDPDDNTLYNIMQTSHGFLDVMKMELAAGRDFSKEFGTDSMNVIVNEAAVRAMGFDDPIGQAVRVWGRDGQIIGVVKDFHIASLYDPIDPMVMRLNPEDASQTYIRPAPGQTAEAIVAFETVFKEFNPNYPMEHDFVDAFFERQYRSEIVVGKLSRWFTGLAIFIACLGLFGLASFTAERRTKEIGIRKVLGASVSGLVGLLGREFVVLVLVAFVVAAPISAVLMNNWLADFEFHTELGWQVFASAILGVILITTATVGFQSVRAALANPADSLRSE